MDTRDKWSKTVGTVRVWHSMVAAVCEQMRDCDQVANDNWSHEDVRNTWAVAESCRWEWARPAFAAQAQAMEQSVRASQRRRMRVV